MTIQAWIRALPPDGIASVVNAYRDAYDAYLQASHVGATGVDAHAEGCRCARDAMLSLAPPDVPETAPTDADEPPWPNWFSCEGCYGWFYGEGERYEDGAELCAACTKERDAEVALRGRTWLRHAPDCPCGEIEPAEGNAHKWVRAAQRGRTPGDAP